MVYKGIIIEESLSDNSILKKINIVKTEVEKVTFEHKTPWLDKWTMHTISVLDKDAPEVAKLISNALESKHEWYADFKNSKWHFIIFRNKVFKINRVKKEEYKKVQKYGVALGIPEYQLDFSPEIKI
ncbi:hypothetical protein FJZ17_01700 [Candidatus Pacearchaeota archaeon]|nr:hypothetical protein [Candidatus Pacearchaeota archaeon]